MNKLPKPEERICLTETASPFLQGFLAGEVIVRLMRQHRKTIEGLSFRMGIPEKRIRQARAVGIRDPYAIRDWLQAITGQDPGPLPRSFQILNPVEEDCCSYCGYPLLVGDPGFEYVGDLFCSIACCRTSRKW